MPPICNWLWYGGGGDKGDRWEDTDVDVVIHTCARYHTLIRSHYLFDPLTECGGGGNEERDVKGQTCILTY